MTPLERAARAIWETPIKGGPNGEWITRPWPPAHKNVRRELEAQARAVLITIRAPSKTMLVIGIEAAEEQIDTTTDTYETYRIDCASDYPMPIWQAMIDAALEEAK